MGDINPERKKTPLEEHVEKVAANIENASANGTETNSRPQVKNSSVKDYSQAEADNDEAKRNEVAAQAKKLADEAQKAAEKEQDSTLYGEADMNKARENLDKVDPLEYYEGDETEKARDKEFAQKEQDYYDENENYLKQVDKMNADALEAKTNAYLQEELASDPTKPEGQQRFKDVLDSYKSLLADERQTYNDSYNRALLFNCFSEGLGKAFGVKPIDFTKHPSVEEVKNNLAKMEQQFDGMLQRNNALRDQRLNMTVNDIESSNEEAKKIKANPLAMKKQMADQALGVANGTKTANDLQKLNLQKLKADLGLDVNTYDAQMEQAKADARKKQVTGMGFAEGIGRGAYNYANDPLGAVGKIMGAFNPLKK